MPDCSAKNPCGESAACSSCAARSLRPLDAAVRNDKTLQDRAIAAALRRIRTVLFVLSGKGGVGKSAVTVNLAVALANRGFRTGILDVDMHGPSVPGLLGLKEHLSARGDDDVLSPVRYRDKVSVVSMDSLLEDRDTAVIWRGPKKTAAIRQFLAGVSWGDLDFLLVDSPPGTGDEHLAVLQTIPRARCVMVTTPQEISLADVRKAFHFLRRVKAEVLGLVENMSGLACPHCGGTIDLFRSGGGEDLARRQNVPFLGRIPIDPAMVAAADKGVPVADLPGDFPAKSAFDTLASSVASAVGR